VRFDFVWERYQAVMSNRPGSSARPVNKSSKPSAAQQYQTWMQTEQNVKQKSAWEGTQEKAFSRMILLLFFYSRVIIF
jgi:hypothetical protein